ncbi:hypothetical protein CYY_000152 [Polysphondylium violaceum]|uniref:Dynein light chain roadblock n=1 Tax=Polysphondylium violaceum TaxID=133409 RepID=A0A8J4V994_9MYCE|nr:hypothetical protein CYY_000152 [Polysphondylium violaceum]
MSEIEESFKRIQTHKGVVGVLIINRNGSVIKSTFDQETSVSYSKMVIDIFPKADQLLKINSDNDELSFFRVRSKDNDIMITPDKDFFLLVVNKIHKE